MSRAFVFAVVLAWGAVGTPLHAATGIAFVHGKGGSDLASPSVARAYWGEDMIRATTRGYAIPHIVCSYDGTQSMWNAASQVAGQIRSWAIANGIDDLVIETHSFGGVVMRWIFSNPDYDARYPDIIARTRWVNTIAAPHRGSEPADFAGTLSSSVLTGWIATLFGQNNDSTRNCRTDSMAYYNQYYLKGSAGRPALPRPFYTIAGTGLWNDLAHSEDYGLATLSGVVGLPGADDGAVAQYSAQGAGTIWFATPANHHHSRRNDYRRIGDSLASEF